MAKGKSSKNKTRSPIITATNKQRRREKWQRNREKWAKDPAYQEKQREHQKVIDRAKAKRNKHN